MHQDESAVIERIAAGLEEVSALLGRPELDPDPDRTDWSSQQTLLGPLEATFEDEVMTPFTEVMPRLDDELGEAIGSHVASAAGRLAALLHAAGRLGDASSLIARAAQVAPPDWDELAAAQRDIAGYVLLQRGRWLAEQDDYDTARPLFDQVVKESGEKALVEAARTARIVAKPLSSAPTLFTWNGFGLGMYGSRDPIGDTHVSTHCLSALFIPVLPLSAYRLIDHGDRSYSFLSKVPLSRFATWYRRLVVLATVVAIAGYAVHGYLNSPSRLAEAAFDEARTAEEAGNGADALVHYETILGSYLWDADKELIDRTGAALTRLYLSEVPEPFAAESVDHATRVLRRCGQLPTPARGQQASTVITDKALEWIAALGDGDDAAITSGAQLLDAAAAAVGAGYQGGLVANKNQLELAMADRLAPDWPLEALDVYARLGSRAGGQPGQDALGPELTTRMIDGAGAVIDALGERYSLIRQATPAIDWWLRAAGAAADRAEVVRARVDAARAEVEEPVRAAALASGDAKTLAGYLAQHPDDQEIAVAAASHELETGDPAAALATLTALGEPGWLIPDARQLLASLMVEAGRLAEADALLSKMVGLSLPHMQRARAAYTAAAQAEQETIIRNAQIGIVPRDLESQLAGRGEAEQAEIFNGWLAKKLAADPELSRLEEEYLRHSHVVPLALTLGTVKLNRANQAAGPARAALLDEAERAFLAIRDDAEGVPSFHLGLGQVYHRLGKPERGEAEFQRVLARKDPQHDLGVANAYRELGVTSRAKEVAESVWNGDASQEYREAAASLLGVMYMQTDLDQSEAWYKRADQNSPSIRISLRDVQARKSHRDGKLADADRAMAAVARYYDEQSAHDPAAANNAAVAYMWRYQFTGNDEHLVAAGKSIESALRLAPDNALLIGNAAGLFELLGQMEVLQRFVDMSALGLDSGDVEALFSTLMAGPLRDRVAAQARKSPSLRRAAGLSEQEMVLAPKNVDGYHRAVKWYRWLDADDRLAVLRDNVASRDSVDTADLDDLRARAMAGEFDESRRASLDETIRRGEARVKKVRPGSEERGAAELLVAYAYRARAVQTADVADVDHAIAAYRRADKAWPELGARNEVMAALLELAALEAARSSGQFDTWRVERRKLGLAMLIRRLAGGASGGEFSGALRTRPELAEAARIATERAKIRPQLVDWQLGVMIGDRALETLGAGYFGDANNRHEAEILVKLDPGDENAQAVYQLVQQHARP